MVALTCMYSSQVMAEYIPWGGADDKRIRHASYKEGEVYHVDAQVGLTTHLKFAEDEVFEQWYSGDSEAFLLTSHKNYVALKPVVEISNTNILVITNKRAYNLFIHIEDAHGFYGVHFNYPQEEAKRELEKKTLAETQDLLDPKNQKNLCALGAKQCNVAYIGAGSKYIRPTEVFDNGTHTFFYFPERVDIPAVFRVRRDESERLTQPITIGNWLVIPRVQESWTLRLGDEVLCVKNNAFTTFQSENRSGTISPSIIRNEIEVE